MVTEVLFEVSLETIAMHAPVAGRKEICSLKSLTTRTTDVNQ
jgi:hypothetical protein